MKKDCTGQYTYPISRYCYNCYNYGHKANGCRTLGFNNNMYKDTKLAASRPIGATNFIRNGVMCYNWNNFGHISRNYRL